MQRHLELETAARVDPSLLNFATPQISLDDRPPPHLSGVDYNLQSCGGGA